MPLSMGSGGDCKDNAPCESVFSTLECELIEALEQRVGEPGQQDAELIGDMRTRAAAERAFDRWTERHEEKYPKATACLTRDREALLALHDFPAAHWTHLRTTNVIESAFATNRDPSQVGM